MSVEEVEEKEEWYQKQWDELYPKIGKGENQLIRKRWGSIYNEILADKLSGSPDKKEKGTCAHESKKLTLLRTRKPGPLANSGAPCTELTSISKRSSAGAAKAPLHIVKSKG
jgi:hypothetical protein